MTKLMSDYSELDFLNFVRGIYNDEYETEEQHIAAILEFKEITEHPSDSDLLFYPEPGKSGPEAVVKEVKEWRAAKDSPNKSRLCENRLTT